MSFDVHAYINHGRWVVDCPFCNNAELANKTDRQFYCSNCRNKAVQGQRLNVDWPTNADEIEQILEQRPEVANRNWQPCETVEQLEQENHSHGIGGNYNVMDESEDMGSI